MFWAPRSYKRHPDRELLSQCSVNFLQIKRSFFSFFSTGPCSFFVSVRCWR